MARRCPDCQLDLDRYAAPGTDAHKCVGGKLVRKPTKIEAARIAKGELDPGVLVSAPQQRPQEAGRLAPRRPTDTQPATKPLPPADTKLRLNRELELGNNSAGGCAGAQPSNRDIIAAIDRLAAQFEALQTVLLAKRTCSCRATDTTTIDS